MTSERLGDMFEVYFGDRWAQKFPLVLIGLVGPLAILFKQPQLVLVNFYDLNIL